MKKHWKKFLLSIFALYLVYGIITIVPAYMENKEWERREQTAIEILNVTNDPNLSQYEKNARLWELHNIPDDGVVNKNGLRYEFSNNYSNKSNNSSNKLSRAQKKRIKKCEKLYYKIKDISDKHGFEDHSYRKPDEFHLSSSKCGDDYDYGSELNYRLKKEDEGFSDEFLVLGYYNYPKNIGEEFNSKDYEVLQDIIDILDISDFSINNTAPITEESINFDNGWVLDYYCRTNVNDLNPRACPINVYLEFKKKI